MKLFNQRWMATFWIVTLKRQFLEIVLFCIFCSLSASTAWFDDSFCFWYYYSNDSVDLKIWKLGVYEYIVQWQSWACNTIFCDNATTRQCTLYSIRNTKNIRPLLSKWSLGAICSDNGTCGVRLTQQLLHVPSSVHLYNPGSSSPMPPTRGVEPMKQSVQNSFGFAPLPHLSVLGSPILALKSGAKAFASPR